MHLELLNAINPFWDGNMMELIRGIKKAIPEGSLSVIARELAAIIALLYLAIKAYMMIAGEGRLEIMPLFRPFVIALAIINFSLIIYLVGLPGNAASDIMKDKFENNIGTINTLMDEKDSLTSAVNTKLIQETDSIAAQLGKADGGGTIQNLSSAVLGSKATTMLFDMGSYITIYEKLIQDKVKMFIQGLITWLCVAIFKAICYCIFFLQVILLAILTWTGPISFAFSIGGPFKDSWVHWAGKYIAVSFYSAIGYFVINLCMSILDYGLRQEIQRYQFFLDHKANPTLFLAMLSQIGTFMIYLVVAIFVALAGIIAIPLVSSWIVQTGGTGSAVFGSGVKGVQKGVSGAGAAVTGGAKAIAGGI